MLFLTRLFSWDNPIARREWAQWRRGRAQWLAPLVLAVALGVLLLRFCMDNTAPGAASSAGSSAGSSTLVQSSDFGRAVVGARALGFLGLVGAVLALLLPPSLAAPSIASEREANLLESLHLTHLSPFEIVLGKWAASLARALWLLIAALPIFSAALMFGGVTPLDVLGVWLVLAVMAAFACAFGIFCSSWARSSLSASRMAYGFGVLHAVFCLNALSVAARGKLALIQLPLEPPDFLHPAIAWLGATHPLYAAGLSWWQPWRLAAARTWLEPMLDLPILAWSIALQVLGTAALLVLSCPAVQRPIEARPFVEPRKRKGKAASNGEAQWWELPVGFLVRGRGPVHEREFITKFRMRAVPRVVLVSEGVLSLGVAIFYVRAFWLGLFDPTARALIWWALLLVAALVGMTSLIVLGATGISREREAGTWDGLKLSFLSPGEVIRGKVSAMLLASVLFSIPFWPLLALCVRSWRTSPSGIGVVEAAGSIAIVMAMAFSHGALGLWLSARLKSSSATLCAMAALFGWNLLVPLAIGEARGDVARVLLDINAAFNPVLALLHMATARPGEVAAIVLPTAGALCLAGTLGLWQLHRYLKREWGRC